MAFPRVLGRRWRRPASRTALVAVVCTAAAIAAAGCGSAGPGTSPGRSANGHQMPASQALELAASAAQKVRTFAASMDITSGGTYSSHLTGTLEEQVKPTVLAHQTFAVTAAGTRVPGGMQTLLTGNAVYLKMSALVKALGKPWVKIPFSSLKKSTGVSLAPLIHQLQGNNPLAQTQALRAATDVRRVGSATINGVPTTEYAGTLNIAKSMAKLDPSLRKLVAPALSATGISTAHFKVWLDSQHQVRKLWETERGTSYHVTSLITITAINQPVHIHVPPASQVAKMPGL